MTDCYHCGTAIKAGREVCREIDGALKSMCCEGCAAVAAIIHESELEAYYRKRTALPQPVAETEQPFHQSFSEIFDDEIIHEQYVSADDGLSEANFIVHSMHCPTCVWLIEKRLGALTGVSSAKINFRAQKLRVEWQADQISLSEIVRSVQSLGYGLVPYSGTAFSETVRAQHQDLLKRLGVAGIFGMQIMVVAVALYASAWTSIEAEYEELFRRLSLLFVLPVMFYSAAPIFTGARRDLRQRTATMDVPIALGLLIAFLASVAATLSGAGEVYFDSIAMFVFIQLIARFLEKSAYRRMTDRIIGLSAAAPSYANRLKSPGDSRSFEVIPALRLSAGDCVLIRPGEAVPADGEILSGSTSIDEALLTGESAAVHRATGDSIFGGSINVSNTIAVRVARPSSDSALASIVRLLEESMSEKPPSRRLTDFIAGYFSVAVVLLALCVAAFWYGTDDWISYPIAVLVVACPCALALAVPTALTAAINCAAKRSILIAHPDAVQALARSSTFLFDKTGTLTESQAQLQHIESLADISPSQALELAASLAHFSNHTISRALVRASDMASSDAEEVETEHGNGVHGLVNGRRYFLGSLEFVHSKVPVELKHDPVMPERGGLIAYLSDDSSILASFHFDNPLREEAKPLIARLQALPVRIALASGDRQFETEKIASELDITDSHWSCSPENKLDLIRKLQSRGECVAMVGDGVNDAPTLAVANVSITPAPAQQIAKAHADILLLDDRLDLLFSARELAEFTVRIMRSNTVWAIAYNLTGISLAAAGHVPPLAAAIGMSASSILVVGNSLRIMSFKSSVKRRD